MNRIRQLDELIRPLGSALVAFSGGVDSSLVAALAARALGERALAVTAVSPALARGELDGARAVAEAVGIAHRTITTDELARVESGLSAGESVVLNPSKALHEGDAVKVAE
ncbi:MAG: 7-cyano-7-deazaguanine synthase [Solirubrobacterales bacterium]|nr:7-cyano-7-deazaguanine synthase [Solirubrobacterales bacterium]